MQKALIGINSLYLWKNISRLSDLQGGQSGGRAVTSICDLDCMSFPHDLIIEYKVRVLLFPSCTCSTQAHYVICPCASATRRWSGFEPLKERYWYTPFRSL